VSTKNQNNPDSKGGDCVKNSCGFEGPNAGSFEEVPDFLGEIDDEFSSWDYPPGTMFMFWWESLMMTSGFFNGVKHNFETAEMSRSYWGRWHEKRR
jgi:hypothetical protein